jgi:hypothetical protein
MSVGEKIRRVLAENPEIQQRRAQLKAIYYVSKHDKTMQTEWHTNLSLHMCLTIWGKDFTQMWFKPLSEYILKGIRTIE